MNIKNITRDRFSAKKKIVSVIHVRDDYDDITDEIERSLMVLKEEMDLPTEEVETAILSRRMSRDNIR
ncbi:hypothetical protein CL614_10195 [archaeon]|nr:hypothetical protein [archaeon]|tara:strand:- start:4308 stop:4511 length:204 start_codon:yes stop_codon:yes gene_type:complete